MAYVIAMTLAITTINTGTLALGATTVITLASIITLTIRIDRPLLVDRGMGARPDPQRNMLGISHLLSREDGAG